MRIAVPCATRRGYLFIQRLTELRPESHLSVFSFPEEAWEPPFRDDIRALTLSRNGQFVEARRLDSPSLASWWEATPVDLMLTVNWRYLIPASIYKRPRLGTFVFHDSLLPTYRGFSPTVWAIINGEDHTGVTLFEITDAVDAGDIVGQVRVPIGPDDTIAEVMGRVTQAYLDLLTGNLDRLLEGTAPRIPQDHSRATFTCKRLPEDNRIDWTQTSERIYNLIRAVSAPYPGAYTYLDGKKLIVWTAQRLPDFPCYVGRVPGRVVELYPGVGTVVLTGDGGLLLTRVQLESQDSVCAADVLNRLTHTLTSKS
jgi:methionyl-tRNA formyltransferase